MRDDRMVIRADAKAIGAVTALSIRAADRWQGSGTKSGECISIFPDGTTIPFTRTRKPSERLAAHITHRNRLTKQDTINSLLMSLPSIHPTD